MAESKFSLSGSGLRYKLLIIEALVFVLPFLMIFYFFYEQEILLDTTQMFVFGAILVLILGGLVILRQIFDKFYDVSRFMRSVVDTGTDVIPDSIQKSTDELQEITDSFNWLLAQFQNTNSQLEQRIFELFTIKELTEAASKVLDINELMRLLLDKAIGVSGAQTGSVFMVDADKDKFRMVAAKGLDFQLQEELLINVKDSPARFVLQDRETILVDDIEKDERIGRPNDPRYASPSFLSMPLFIKEKLVAVLNLSSKETKQVFDRHDKETLSIMINEIGFALENARLHSEVEENLRQLQTHSDELVLTNDQLKQEVSVRKLAEQARRESEVRYRLLVENANDAIFVVQDNVINFPNPITEKLTGYSADQIKKVQFISLVHSKEREWVEYRHQRLLSKEESPSTYTVRILDKFGKVLWVQISSVFIKWKGKPAGLYFLRDITDQKNLEAQFHEAQKMEAIGNLAGGIAHQFNNMLMGIQGNAQLMMLDLSTENPYYLRLKRIEQFVKQGADLTGQLLGFARKGKYEIKPIDINKLVQQTSDIYGRTKKEITIHRSFQKKIWMVEADPSQIEQVMMNIYVYSAQSMPDGGDLFIQSENIEMDEASEKAEELASGLYVKITITDTGVGMDSETQQRIFEPFFTDKDTGLNPGLGLAAAYGIINNHGGLIDVYSEKNKGTTFYIYLPAKEMIAIQEEPVPEELLTGTEVLLMVDDEEMVLEVGKEMLESLGYTILTAKDGKEAIEVYEKNHETIDAVILDMIMPELSGGETFNRLKEINPEIRVLLSSGYGLDDKVQAIMDRGCKAFLQKPFKIEELSQKLRTILED